MGKKSAPKAPDPAATAAAQAAMNKETAIAQYGLNATNQNTPDGSLSYKQIGTWPDGTPRYEATTSLSGANQQIYDVGKQTELSLAGLARDQAGRMGEIFGTPFKLGNEATEARLWELGKGRLEPEWARDEEAMRTRLKNSGIQEGSEAWDAEMRRLTNAKTDSRNQLLLSGRSLANQELLTERNQPINETTAFLSGSQVANPSFVNTPSPGVGGVDYASLVQDKYKGDLSNYQAKMGGLFGLAGNVGSAALMFSDERLKDDMKRVGETDNGLPLYSYTYKGDDTPQIGLKAQDVVKKNPDAVKRVAGYLAVDYKKAVAA